MASPEGVPSWRPFEDVAETKFKYMTTHDKALHLLAVGGFNTAADGHQLAPAGQFWALSYEPPEAAQLMQDFQLMLEDLHVNEQDLVGNFLVVEHLDHDVNVYTFDRRGKLLVEFASRQMTYQAWLEGTSEA